MEIVISGAEDGRMAVAGLIQETMNRCGWDVKIVRPGGSSHMPHARAVGKIVIRVEQPEPFDDGFA